MWFVQLVQALAWPVALVTVAAIYKPEVLNLLPSFLRRNLKLEAFGVKAEVGAAEKLQDEKPPAKEQLIDEGSIGPNGRMASKVLEAGFKANLSSFEPQKREALLLRDLANTKLISSHEFIYNRMFGSQIQALKALNERGTASVSDALEFWKPYLEKYPDLYPAYSFNQWLDFLVRNNLVERDGDRLRLTVFGKDFLMYLAERALTENKPW